MKTPDITPAQVVALVQAIIAVLVAFAVPISDAQSAALLGLTTIVAAVLLGADAAIRRGRAKVQETKEFNNNEAKYLQLQLEAAQRELEELRQGKA